MKTDQTNGLSVGRRTFLTGLASGTVALVGFNIRSPAIAQQSQTISGRTDFDAWIAVKTDGAVVIQVSQAEMGQGIHTTFPAIIAEEMDADWPRVELEMAPHDAAYYNPKFPQMFTGNAESTRTFWPVIRKAGATAREMLALAAAERWSVPRAEIRTENGIIHHDVSSRRVGFGEIAAAASKITLEADAPLKNASDWKLLRTSLPRRDLREKVTGAPIFGLDAAVDGMVYAAIRHADTPGGTIAEIDRSSLTGVRGILDIVTLPNAVAVVADSTWRAIKAADALAVRFAPGPRDNFSSASLDAQFADKMDGNEWTEVEVHGDVSASFASLNEQVPVEAEYHSAWQAHATMEPMNCIADVREGSVRIIAPTQGQTMVAVRVAKALDVPVDSVEVERTFLGGGFGRRLIADYAVEAALVSRAMKKPVQIIWTREEDMRHDHFRPHVRNRLSAVVDDDGLPVALDHKIVSPTILSAVVAEPIMRWVYPQPDPSCFEGMTREALLYGIDNQFARGHILDVAVQTMVWRTTGYGPNVFAIESFVDELAERSGQDPLEFRISLLTRTVTDARETAKRRRESERGIAVLELLKQRSNFGSPIGMAQGIAYSHCFDTHIAQSVDVSVMDDGTLDIHKVTTVLDGGYVLDPDITRANIEGGVYWGLTQALTSEITFADGQAEQSNFDTFEILALPEAPPNDLHWIDSGESPGGLGEVGPVPTAPALANAIAAASGRRLRTLPLSRHGIHTRYRKQFVPPAHDLTAPKN